MENNSVTYLNNSVSRFIHLMSSQTWKSSSMPIQSFESMANLLKHLKPVLDDIDDDKIASTSNLSKACENLDDALNASTDFIQQWSPKMSKILSVIQSEHLLTKIRSFSLEISGILCRSLRNSPASIEIMKLQSWGTEKISKCIEQAFKYKNEKLSSYSKHLTEVIDSLSLWSSHELLTESFAVEKERMKFNSNLSDEKMDQINQIIDLLDLIRNYILETGSLASVNDVTSIPDEFPPQDIIHANSFNYSVHSSESESASDYTHDNYNSGYDAIVTWSHVDELVVNLKSSSNALQTEAALEIRLLAKHNMENRVIIGKCEALTPLVSLLHSEIKITQEHAVTALLNLSLNEENKSRIAENAVIEPLIHVLKLGSDVAKENSAATLFSLSLLQDYKSKIGRSGAVKPLVNLLSNGTLRGKKDALTALFNLSICHENKARIIQAPGAVKYLVKLLEPCRGVGVVDKAVAVLANLSTISEGRLGIARENGIPLIVEIVETGSGRGKENGAAILLEMCVNSNKFCKLVLEEGAVIPLVALSQSGTPRAKEKAQQLLSHFRNQREGTSRKNS